MGIKTFPHPPYSADLALCDFCLFPKLTGCHYETIEGMKEAVTKVINTLTQEDFLKKLLEQYKCITAGGDCFEGDLSFMCVLSIKVPIRKNLETYRMPHVKLQSKLSITVAFFPLLFFFCLLLFCKLFKLEHT